MYSSSVISGVTRNASHLAIPLSMYSESLMLCIFGDVHLPMNQEIANSVASGCTVNKVFVIDLKYWGCAEVQSDIVNALHRNV